MVEKKKNIDKKNIKNKVENSFSTVEVVVLIIMSVIVSFITGCLITNNLNKSSKQLYNEDIKKIVKNYNYIIDNYYEDVDKKKLINGAISGMLASLGDDYTYAFDENDSERFNKELDGEYQGLGVGIVSIEGKGIVIYDVFKNSPAEKAGLKVGDIVLKIDNVSFIDISNYVSKSSNTEFKVTIKRDNKEQTYTINKELVTIDSVLSKTFKKNGKKIGYIYISIFSKTSQKQFKEQLTKLEKEKIDSLIIDVRDNSGGHLTTAVDLISQFLDSKHIIYQTDTKGVIRKFYSNGKKTKKYPIVILQNKNSASASEMLSAALKEEYGATVVGETSFGKGTVQELLDTDKDIEFKITTKRWLTPKGNSINKKGVAVDVEVSLSEEYQNNPSDETDNQLQKALEVISKK